MLRNWTCVETGWAPTITTVKMVDGLGPYLFFCGMTAILSWSKMLGDAFVGDIHSLPGPCIWLHPLAIGQQQRPPLQGWPSFLTIFSRWRRPSSLGDCSLSFDHTSSTRSFPLIIRWSCYSQRLLEVPYNVIPRKHKWREKLPS